MRQGEAGNIEHAAEIAGAFVAARRAGRSIAVYPGIVPATLDAAYVIQDHAMMIDDGAIGGWKVGRIPDALADRFGADRLAGPVRTRSLVTAESGAPVMPVYAGGFAAVEAEFLLCIAQAPEPGKTRYTLDEAAALIGAVRIGIEIASSPFPGINALGPAVTVSDVGNNNGLVLGAAIADWNPAEIERWPVEVWIDGCRVGTGQADAMPDGVLGAARFLLELLARRGHGLRSGQWISSGAITGVHDVGLGANVEARFGPDLRVACEIGAATAIAE